MLHVTAAARCRSRRQRLGGAAAADPVPRQPQAVATSVLPTPEPRSRRAACTFVSRFCLSSGSALTLLPFSLSVSSMWHGHDMYAAQENHTGRQNVTAYRTMQLTVLARCQHAQEHAQYICMHVQL